MHKYNTGFSPWLRFLHEKLMDNYKGSCLNIKQPYPGLCTKNNMAHVVAFSTLKTGSFKLFKRPFPGFF